MRQQKRLVQRALFWGLVPVLAAACLITAAGGPARSGSLLASGGPRLVSVQPLPPMDVDGPMCQWQPAAANAELMAALTQAPGTPGTASDPRNLIRDRPPLRVIKDPYPTYSAVAMDFNHDEIVLLDENLFQVMAYDRTANTPPSATMTEPKRVIGGHETKIEFNCGLYIDPKNGDIYAVNNDTLDTLVIFNREAKGNVPPTRELSTPHRTYGIAVDEQAEELYMTVQDPPEIVVYNKYASGRDKPKRIMRGNKTLLTDAHGMGIDTKNKWMFVANYGNGAKYAEPGAGGNRGGGGGEDGGGFGGGPGRIPGSGYFEPPKITVYPLNAEGDVAPIRTIQGPKTMLDWPAHMFIDQDRGDIYVANDGGNAILVFHETDNGNVAPYRVISGAKSNVKNPTGVYVDPKNKELVVSNMGNHMATVYPLDANGDVAPLRVIRAAPLDTPALQIGNPGAVAYDSKREEILVPN
jgi:DNA-binding beta-propeller fold protein YncE